MSVMMNVNVIVCMYSCHLCGVHRVAVNVPVRTSEDVNVWMDDVAIPALVRDHESRSPGCKPSTFSEVMIPMTGRAKVGGPVNN